MLPEPVRKIIARAARLAMHGKRGAARRRRVYMTEYLKIRKLAIALRETE